MTTRVLALLVLLALPWVGAQGLTDRPTEELLQYGEALYARDCLSALYVFEQVLAREPDNAPALIGKGRSLVCQGAAEEGVAALEAALAQDLSPTEAGQAQLYLASARVAQYEAEGGRQAERLQEALDALSAAEAAGASGAEVANLRGTILYRQGQLAGAKEALERAAELAPERADYLENLGLVYLGLGELEAAVRVLQRALTLEPESASARNQLGAAYALLGRCEEAIFELEQAVALEPERAEANFNLGRALFECDQLERARPYFETVVGLASTAFPPVYTYLARIDLAERDFDSAVTQATKGALLSPQDAEAHYWLGQAYEARSSAEGSSADMDKAHESYQSALKIDGGYRPAREALGE